MDMMRWLLRAKRWAQDPPSARHVMLVLAVVAVCLLVAGFEAIWGWPEALKPNRLRP